MDNTHSFFNLMIEMCYNPFWSFIFLSIFSTRMDNSKIQSVFSYLVLFLNGIFKSRFFVF